MKFKNSIKKFTNNLFFGVGCIFITLIILCIVWGWSEEKNIKQCMKDYPDRTYEDCESALSW